MMGGKMYLFDIIDVRDKDDQFAYDMVIISGDKHRLRDFLHSQLETDGICNTKNGMSIIFMGKIRMWDGVLSSMIVCQKCGIWVDNNGRCPYCFELWPDEDEGEIED